MLADLLTQPVEVRSPGAPGDEDEFGNAAQPWSAWRPYLGRMEPLSGSEDVIDRDTQIGDQRLFLPPDAEIDGRDQVRHDGLTYEVIGPPDVNSTPAAPHHIVARLRRIDGL